MKIGIIGAMEEEIRRLKSIIASEDSQSYAGAEYFFGKIGSHDIVLVECGIGKVNATLSVAVLKEVFQVEAIINSGSAGAIDPGLKIGDIVIAHSLCHHDVDVTAFGYEIGQMAGMPTVYYPQTPLMRLAQEAARAQEIEPIIGMIVSGDQFIEGKGEREHIRRDFPKARACDMESAAIAQACHQLSLPYLIIRAISDEADGQASMDFDEFILMAGKVTSELVEATLLSLED